jgi:D-glycero-alpha-D-manno-heptose-7-phosphate kinase
MLGFSGVSRLAEVHAKKNVDNIKEGKIDNLLLEMANSTNEAIIMLAKEKEMSIIGELLDTAWSIKRNLADGVTQKWIDNIYFSAIENGAYGGKLMGAGGGGFFMFLVPPNLQEHFKKAMKEIKVWVPFQFDNNGSQVILNNM